MRHEYVDRGYASCIAAFASASTLEREMRFEWRDTLEAMPVNALYIMDDARSWWHFCIDAVLELLQRYRPSMLIGASMGGYGALLFGSLTMTPARAFAPQSMLTAPWDARYADYLAIVRAKTPRQDLLDLSLAGDQYHVYYCRDQEEDRLHAERLSVRLFPLPCDHHRVGKCLDLKAVLA